MTQPFFGNDPVQFLRKNLLTLDPLIEDPKPEQLHNGTVLVKLADISDKCDFSFRHRRRKGLATLVPKSNKKWWTKPTTLWMVTEAQKGDADAFPAYICPWGYGTVCTTTLGNGNDAQVMFTGDMDGCTFGVGMPNPQGGVLVGHANQIMKGEGASDADLAGQRQAQRDLLTDKGVGNSLVDPDDYKAMVTRRCAGRTGRKKTYDMGTKAVTVGLWNGHDWEFYYQHQVVAHGGWWREGLELVKVH